VTVEHCDWGVVASATDTDSVLNDTDRTAGAEAAQEGRDASGSENRERMSAKLRAVDTIIAADVVSICPQLCPCIMEYRYTARL
jgi:hypothetical protein